MKVGTSFANGCMKGRCCRTRFAGKKYNCVSSLLCRSVAEYSCRMSVHNVTMYGPKADYPTYGWRAYSDSVKLVMKGLQRLLTQTLLTVPSVFVQDSRGEGEGIQPCWPQRLLFGACLPGVRFPAWEQWPDDHLPAIAGIALHRAGLYQDVGIEV